MPKEVLPQTRPHPLKLKIRQRQIAYWQLRKALGGRPSEATICRMLNGIDPLPEEIEARIRDILDSVEA